MAGGAVSGLRGLLQCWVIPGESSEGRDEMISPPDVDVICQGHTCRKVRARVWTPMPRAENPLSNLQMIYFMQFLGLSYSEIIQPMQVTITVAVCKPAPHQPTPLAAHSLPKTATISCCPLVASVLLTQCPRPSSPVLSHQGDPLSQDTCRYVPKT